MCASAACAIKTWLRKTHEPNGDTKCIHALKKQLLLSANKQNSVVCAGIIFTSCADWFFHSPRFCSSILHVAIDECEKERLLESIIHKPVETVSLLLCAHSCVIYIYSTRQKVHLLSSPLYEMLLDGGHAAAVATAAAPKEIPAFPCHGKMKCFVPHKRIAPMPPRGWKIMRVF